MTFSSRFSTLDSESPNTYLGMPLIGRFWASCSAKCLRPFTFGLLMKCVIMGTQNINDKTNEKDWLDWDY